MARSGRMLEPCCTGSIACRLRSVRSRLCRAASYCQQPVAFSRLVPHLCVLAPGAQRQQIVSSRDTILVSRPCSRKGDAGQAAGLLRQEVAAQEGLAHRMDWDGCEGR